MQRPTVVNVKDKSIKIDVYIGRPSIWGNPFLIGKDGNRFEVCEKFRAFAQTDPKIQRRLPELAGKVIGCFCHPLPCHGDVLAEMVENLPPLPISIDVVPFDSPELGS
jgi:hypothetical protein